VTVSEHLAANGYKPARIAVEINEVILPKDQYETHNLCEGDLVEIVTFMGGG
ncbi:MAG: sulfur carrier protein ThiS, partial [Oscillospiraceae bacterium]|nr:sulfur carrier protein ThiS [Oscillospiraceae bacterium]